ncbi:Mitochondrial outer membrane protein porin 2, partial [Bienertia sinuspersici]
KGGLSTGEVVSHTATRTTWLRAKLTQRNNLADIVPSTKVITSIKLPDLSSHKLGGSILPPPCNRYFSYYFNKNPIVDLTATLGTPAIAFGVEAGYDTTSGNFTKGDKGDTIKAWYLHHLDQLKKIVRAKLSNHGKLDAIHHQVIPKSMVTISSEYDTLALDKCPRFGLTLALKP